MRFQVRHETHYSYSTPVALAPHILRLSPRPEDVAVRRQGLHIEPGPVQRDNFRDPFGNPVTQVAFAGTTRDFIIVSEFEVETFSVPAPGALLSPLPWGAAEDGFQIYRDGGVHPSVRAFAAEISARQGGWALGFLDDLTQTLFARTDRRIRIDGYAQSPEETLLKAEGACRDLSLLFIAAARSLGLPARFVSGYQAEADTPDGQRHLHAWPEVFLPGVGWRGYDPTHGLPVSDGHVALCAAPDQMATMPVEGGYYFDGTEVTSTLTYNVRIATQS
ncbi:transglutaminase family protein [Rhodoblastus acidophilus]|uniref:Transglutaminase family protein n=1 Tax=Candidatus Rhodoblastus alkanivorans TaxID=2954117 RepID=A0ABS9Z5Y6_9HYPH|nr:transglutaminase family protein [Candidatus Rhodoblastus alkanivorans]MCI4678618.1 transglutaminase family protein [Candidatus Rhodoblastus alkanivorans]MCI4683028.1 transglutaminase family protein [Candidatus Rhodoblastus alkanivorans]MDI4640338.1 transglutaminase family protein [Rhodoblastus acidophilus]